MNIDAIKAGRGLTERSACRTLSRLAAKVPAEQVIVELGAYCGRTTAWLAYGSSRGRGARVVSIDPWDLRTDMPAYAVDWEPGYRRGDYADPKTLETYRRHLARCGVQHLVDPIRGFSAAVGAAWPGPAVGLLWHDADHSVGAVAADLEAWLPHLAPTATVALHDVCHPSLGVLDGTRRVLTTETWGDGEIHPWARKPDRRGMLVLQRSQ